MLGWFFARAEAGPLFQAAFLPFDVGFSPVSVAVGDLNGDGRQDLAVANYGSNTVSVLLGHGDDTFGTKTDFRSGEDARGRPVASGVYMVRLVTREGAQTRKIVVRK